MAERWSEEQARSYLARYAERWGEDLALRTYSNRLVGRACELVLHGGGNTSVKGLVRDVFGEEVPAIYMKASGYDLAAIAPEDHPALDLEYLRRLRAVPALSDEALINEFRKALFDQGGPTPSVETLAHALIPKKYIDHTHADAILTLTNQVEGEKHVREALGDDVIVVDYVLPGLELARAAADAFEARPNARGMVWMLHGIVTWGGTARESYEAMVDLVARAEAYVARRATPRLRVSVPVSVSVATERLARVAPIVRGVLARPTGDADRPHRRVILQPLITQSVLDFLAAEGARELALTPPLTSDHIIRTRAFPLWVDTADYDDPQLKDRLTSAVQEYSARYRARVERWSASGAAEPTKVDFMPLVVLVPGLGALCAGKDVTASTVARDITAHTLDVKMNIAAMGTYRGLPDPHLFDMEYRAFQQAKLDRAEPPLAGEVALVTGAAGAIGVGICEELLRNGCHVAATDLPGPPLESLVDELRSAFGARVIGVPLDVTDAASVTEGFATIIRTWGGIDLLVVNAGVALVSPLAEMDVAAFRKLERVNVEGTLLVLAEAARHFKAQATGGDVVVMSTKNVFAPGARFGAYSATKAAAHQLARIASLELAELNVRVNMVAPDAVFAHGSRRSGLWAEVGPDRMHARGLDESGLEEYYRSRNLLKARVTATHVARAVLFFATRQTPTTGATLPVDGGLPDAAPR